MADGEAEAAAAHERCATRLSLALLGTSATPELLASGSPQGAVDALLDDPAFVERFARFVNSRFNPEPGATVAEDASYTLAKHVLAKRLRWREMFVGAYDVGETVTADPDGLGYFRSRAWMVRYAGNEEAGLRLAAAYRILQNTTGLELTATTNVEGVDLTADGRQATACRGCHYDGWYALDLVARTLSTRRGMGEAMRFDPPTAGPQTVLGGQSIGSDAELVTSLVASKNFSVNACRLAFAFLYGRAETTCEGGALDACVDAFEATGTMQSALATLAKDASFCL